MYSLATGQLVREYFLGMGSLCPYFSDLDYFTVASRFGAPPSAGLSFLAAAGEGSGQVHLFVLDHDQAADTAHGENMGEATRWGGACQVWV